MPSNLDQFSALVCKTGVGLGLLSPAQRALALLVAAQALPLGAAMSEPEVNAALKGCLAGPASFLDTDHVELRRWLVDTGYWRRDGFGRSYERTPDADLQPGLLEAIDQVRGFIGGVALSAWIAERRADAQAQRAARRAAWVPSPAQSTANSSARAGG
jgi:Uncharacterized protein conserved in bacteria (DUF2087)